MANFNWAQMLFDEPMATQGFRTTGNDPLNQFASWYQFGQNLGKGAEARRAQREAQEMARREANSGQTTQGGIGVNANGVYGVPSQPSGGIGVDASGVHGVEQPTTGSYGNFTGQIPNSPYPVNNTSTLGGLLGGDLGKLATISGLDLLKGLKGGGESDHGINITDQTIGQNYNKRIDGQVGGLNIPRTPQQNGFGAAISNAENPLNSFTGGSLANFLNPVSSGDSAQVAGGATNLSADNPFARSFKYLGADYDKMAYVKSALDNGVKNPLVAMAMYDQMIAPLRESAREDELRNAFFVLRNADPNSKEYNDAVSLIQYYKKDPYMEEDHQYKMGNVMNPDYGSGSTAGNAVLRALGDYTEGDQWMSPDGTGDSRTQCSNFVSDVLRKIGLNIGSPNGDELMKQFGSAYHTGIDGIQAGDVLNFKDHVGIYVGNGQYVARNSSGGVHQGSMEEAIQAFGQPLGYGSVGELTGTNRNRKYIKDPNRVTQREAYEYGKQKDAMNFALRNRAIDARVAAKNGTVGNRIGGGIGFDKKGNLILDYDNDMRFGTAMDAFKKEFDNPTGKEGKMTANAMMGVVGSLSPIYKYLVSNGLSENEAKLVMRDLLNDRLGKDYQGKVGYEMIGDIVDRIALGGGQQPTQQPINGIGGYGTKVNEKKKDGSNHVGFKNILGFGKEADEFKYDGQQTTKQDLNNIQMNTNRVAKERALANGVIAGYTDWGTPVDKYGNEVEIDQFGEAKDGLTPEQRRDKVAKEREDRFGTIQNQY